MLSSYRAYDANGWQPEFKAVIPQLKVETILGMPFAAEYRKLAPNPRRVPGAARDRAV